MPRRSLLLSLFAASLFAVSAFGDETYQIHVAPRLPTTVTPIEFRFSTFCGDEIDSITRTGSVITIRYRSFLCNPPFPHMARVPLPDCPEMPLYGELDLPATTTLGRIDVRIDGPDEALTWGFITVTNNDTQQVTTVTPQQ